jgi:predicted phage baseplate assembly protein
MVRELEKPSEEEVKRFQKKLKEDFEKESSQGAAKTLEERLKEDVDKDEDPDTKSITAVWVRWYEVENFFKSKKENRHYTFDPYTGVITFGDGNKGKVPPAGRDNVKAQVCYRGGGTKGNVGKSKLTVVESEPQTGSLRINTVTNPDPAAGGADVETIEEAKQRGPWLLKHRYRAVTKEDFEELAVQASREVAKVLCLTEREGEIKLIIIPKGEQEKLLPKSMLIRTVREYLDEHRLITSKMIVTGPDYRDISIEAEVVTELQSKEFHRSSSIRTKIEENLRQFFHPLEGGPKGEGWPMGRAVHISEIYYLLEDVEGVDYVKEVILEKNRRITRIEIGPTEFPYLKKIDIQMNTD